MKNKLKTVNIIGIEWKYAISNGTVRIYEPGTKQIKTRVKISNFPKLDNPDCWFDDNDGIGPGDVKRYIKYMNKNRIR